MKIFLDTADLEEIKKWSARGLIDGVTTNPTWLSQAGSDPTARVRAICDLLPDGLISVEVTEKEPDNVLAQARQIARLGANVLVKIPCHLDYYELIKTLVQEGVNINITLLFSAVQGLCMAKLGVAFISPFVGRLDDAGGSGIDLIADLRLIMDQYQFPTQILAASLRDQEQLVAAIGAGADAITVAPKVLEKAVHHILTDQGMKQFDLDWAKLGVKKFP